MHGMALPAKFAAFTILIFANPSLMSAQGPSIYTLPAGTRIRLKMDVELSSHVASANDTFTATVAKPVRINDQVLLPAGAVVEGRVTGVERAGAAHKGGRLEVVFETLKVAQNAPPRRIEGGLVNKFGNSSSQLGSILSIFGGAAAGALIGSLGGGSGALLGAGAGAGAGTGIALLKKGKDVRIKKDQEFEIELKKDVVLPVMDY